MDQTMDPISKTDSTVNEVARIALRDTIIKNFEEERKQTCYLALGTALKNRRYTIVRRLGRGFTSIVWLAKDEQEGRWVACKTLSTIATEKYAGKEIELLRKVAKHKSSNQGFGVGHLLAFYEDFVHKGPHGDHAVIVTEPLALNLRELLRLLPMPTKSIVFAQNVFKQVIAALKHLHEDCNVVYADLKVSNIAIRPRDIEAIIAFCALEDPARLYWEPPHSSEADEPLCQFNSDNQPLPPWVSAIFRSMTWGSQPRTKVQGDWAINAPDEARLLAMIEVVLIDVGHSELHAPERRDLIQTEEMRAPEVILGNRWGYPVDIWALGCSLVQTMTGEFCTIFVRNAPTPQDRLCTMSVVLEQNFPDHMKEDSLRWKTYFENEDAFDSCKAQALKRFAGESIADLVAKNRPDLDRPAQQGLTTFMLRCMALDPACRPTASELLEDPWFA